MNSKILSLGALAILLATALVGFLGYQILATPGGAEQTGTHGAHMAPPEETQSQASKFHRAGKYRLKLTVADGGAVRVRKNSIEVSLQDAEGQPVEDAELRVMTQADPGKARQSPTRHHDHSRMQQAAPESMAARTGNVLRLEPLGNGHYRGQIELTKSGSHALVADMSTERLGHADLIVNLKTGRPGLTAASATPEGVAHYSCSMHPSVRQAQPGECPICGMNLIPVTREQLDSGVITVDAQRRQLIGVEIGSAARRKLDKSIRAVGQVNYDERRMTNVTLKFDAWVEDLQADFVGKPVQRGETLFSVYSPALLSAQQEYLETRRRLSARGPDDSLVRAAKQRLMLWDISAAQLRALERRGEAMKKLPIAAPASGTVVEKRVNAGSHVKAGELLLRIADLSTVWIDAEVYEDDLPLVKPGMQARVTFPYLDGDALDAKVDYVYPYLEPQTRTARVRLVLDNPGGALKPDMYAQVALQANLGERLMVPEEAVLMAGETSVVFKDLGEGGKLQPVKVRTGQRAEGYIEIIDGLNEGDRVVTSGNFLIAAEAKLKTGIDQW